jgi:putative Mg2+ transporter-C (MgtC) family protein
MVLNTFLDSLTSTKITLGSAVLKMVLSFLAGGIVGFNRERQKHPAGFRTHILISMGSALLMILSIYIPQAYMDFKNGDPGRIAAQVVSGIGFLGAGAILKLGTNVRGLTTAASIWLMSAIGLTIGAGLYVISFITVLLTIFTLVVLERIEHRWFPQFHTRNIQIKFKEKEYPDEDIKAILKKNNIQIIDYSLIVQNESGIHSVIDMSVRMPEETEITKLANSFNKLQAIHSVKICC